MPEGDTVWRTARRLDQALSGRVLTESDFRVPRWAHLDLVGQPVEATVSRGKHLLTRLPDLTIHTHLKMEGSWHIYRRGERWRRPGFQARAILGIADHQTVGFSLGKVSLIPSGAEARVLGHLGPDLLGPDWDPVAASKNLKADPHRSVGEALLDQSLIAGVGNVYRSEICFLAGVHPDQAIADVDVDAIVGIAKRLLEANRDTGAQVTTGDSRPGRDRWVYGRKAKPCRRCGAPIAKRDLSPAGRVVYWCPYCQATALAGDGARLQP